MVKLLLVTCILATWALVFVNCEQYSYSYSQLDVSSSKPPTPALDCSTLMFKMADCLPYLTKGGNETKPEPSCCSGFKIVEKTDFECICEALKSSSNLGFDIDMSKAIKLPSSCGDKSTRLTSCFSAGAPISPPGSHPPSRKPPSIPSTAAPVIHKTPAPAPAPLHAAAHSAMPTFTLISIAIAIVPFFFVVA